MNPKNTLPRVVILGAGFGGLEFAKMIQTDLADVTLVDRENHHLFQPLLYQVATAGLSAPEIAQPIRSILRDKEDIKIYMDSVQRIDLEESKVYGEKNVLDYDYLIIAMGGQNEYFGHNEWGNHTIGLKSLDDAILIRRNLLLALEKAETLEEDADPEEREELMTTVVIGGGPTGVEMAGAIVELHRHVVKDDFHHIDPKQTRVVLVEAAPRLLSHLHEELSRNAKMELESMGVEVRLSSPVQDIKANCVELENETIRASTIIWAAGIGASSVVKALPVEKDRLGKVKVEPDLSLPGYPKVFAIGDVVSLVDPNGVSVPAVSPAAIQMGDFSAQLINQELKLKKQLKSRPQFIYWDKGSMATIGRTAAVAQMGNWRMDGFIAWLAWLFVHLIFLVGMRNRIVVFIQWAYSYLTYRRGARIIFGKERKNSNI